LGWADGAMVLMRRMPPLTVVAPVYVFSASRYHSPTPVLVTDVGLPSPLSGMTADNLFSERFNANSLLDCAVLPASRTKVRAEGPPDMPSVPVLVNRKGARYPVDEPVVGLPARVAPLGPTLKRRLVGIVVFMFDRSVAPFR